MMLDKTLELGHLNRHLNIVTRDNDIFNDLIDSQWRVKVVKEENMEGIYGTEIETVYTDTHTQYTWYGYESRLNQIKKCEVRRIQEEKHVLGDGRIYCGDESNHYCL